MTERTARVIADAAAAWLASLDPTQRTQATFPFETPERMVWDYVPGDREGLSYAEMRPAQRAAADAVIETVMSERGAREVAAVVALEPILGALEAARGRPGSERRDPERYWFAVFGDPGGADAWSWRIGGHHMAIQVTVDAGRVIGSAPSFLGSNPATVPSGPMNGSRALEGEERLARAFLATMSPDQRRVAIVDPVAPPDIRSGSGARADVTRVPTGIRHDALDPGQRHVFEALIRHYLGRAADEIGAMEWDRVQDEGLAAMTFAWAGPDTPGRGHYYAVRGPRFLIEYDNTQNGANHIHSVWRDLTNDWGEDRLAAHYRTGHAPS